MKSVNTWGILLPFLLATNAATTSTAAITIPAATTIAVFDGTNGNGSDSSLVVGQSGYFYGTTPAGGAYRSGNVFCASTNGTITNLASFDGTNGFLPVGALVEDAHGVFWGVTQFGGSSGQGSVFSVTPTGTITPRFSFQGANGAYPSAGLIFGQDGYLYGTTSFGGSSNRGTLFRFATNGSLTTLANFVGTNGFIPNASLRQATNGLLYGTTLYGGADDHLYGGGIPGGGTIFGISTNGDFSFVTSFYGTNGAQPNCQLVESSGGNLYGTTIAGGIDDTGFKSFKGYGTVFKVSESGQIVRLHSFTGTDGAAPRSGLTRGRDGNLYGTTSAGGVGFIPLSSSATGGGTIFQISTNDDFQSLLSFSRTTVIGAFNSLYDEGQAPESSLTLDPHGTLVGTTPRSMFPSAVNGGIYRLVDLAIPVLSVLPSPNETFSFTWPAFAKQTYGIEWSTNPAGLSWYPLGTYIWATNSASLSAFAGVANPQRFYRVILLR